MGTAAKNGHKKTAPNTGYIRRTVAKIFSDADATHPNNDRVDSSVISRAKLMMVKKSIILLCRLYANWME